MSSLLILSCMLPMRSIIANNSCHQNLNDQLYQMLSTYGQHLEQPSFPTDFASSCQKGIYVLSWFVWTGIPTMMMFKRSFVFNIVSKQFDALNYICENNHAIELIISVTVSYMSNHVINLVV